jgi:hypothetical protein
MIEKDFERLSENNNNHTNVQILPILQSADVANLVSESVEPNLFDSSSSTITLHQPLSQSFEALIETWSRQRLVSAFGLKVHTFFIKFSCQILTRFYLDFETIVLETISKIEAHVENHSAKAFRFTSVSN